MLVKLQFFRFPSSWFSAEDWLRAARSVSARSSSSPMTPPGFRKLHSTSRRSPSAGRCTFARAAAASFSGSRRPSIGRILWFPRSHDVHRRKHSGRSRLQRWVRHAVARQSATPQVAAIEPDETLYGLFDLSTGSVETASECDSSDPAAEVLMVNGPCSPPGFSRDDGGDGGVDPSPVHNRR